MKILYTFQQNKLEERDISEAAKDSSGGDVIVTKKVKELVPYNFVIKQPNRSLKDSAALFYGKTRSFAIKSGLVPAAVLENQYGDKDKAIDLYKSLTDKVQDLHKLELVKEKDEKQKEEYRTLLGSVTKINREIQDVQSYRDNLSAHTADSYAREKAIEWWILQLSYKEISKDNHEPLFGEGDYETKYQKLIEIEETEDVFLNDVMAKLASLISFYYMYPDLAVKDKFDLVLKMHVEDRKIQTEEVKSEEKVVEKPIEKIEEKIVEEKNPQK